MMEQRNQMLRELRLNKKESMGVVSVPNGIFFISCNLLDYLLMLNSTRLSSPFFLPLSLPDLATLFIFEWVAVVVASHEPKNIQILWREEKQKKKEERPRAMKIWNFCSSHYAMSYIMCDIMEHFTPFDSKQARKERNFHFFTCERASIFCLEI
jgi:hypothetical protein